MTDCAPMLSLSGAMNRPRRRSPRALGPTTHRTRVVRLAVTVALAVTTLACRTPEPPTPAVVYPNGSVPMTAHDLGLGLTIDLPAGWSVSPLQTGRPQPGGGCVTATGSLRAGDTQLAVRMADRRCPHPPERPLNGKHGDYLDIEDVLEPTRVEHREAPAGPVTLFEQAYTECTNSCTTTTDRVALVALGRPPDADHPTVMIVAESVEADYDQLAGIASALR